MINESIEFEVGDRIEVGEGLMMPAGTYRVVNKYANYVGPTREEEINHPVSCLRQFALKHNMRAEDVFDLINVGIDEFYRQGRITVEHDK